MTSRTESLDPRTPGALQHRAGVALTLGTALALLPSAAWSQEAALQDDEASEIVVSGIRRSLQNALDAKRSASSIVDAISAEDVGKFPDINVAESVQRISGVQINRVGGEGRTVNIRGLPANFTLATLNGRIVPNAFSFGSARSFDFSILPPEFIRTLEVYKSPVADIEEGGLAGTVNIKTPRALEIGRRVISVSAQGQNESNSGKWSPRVSAVYSDVFADGRLGLSLSGSYTQRRAETQNAGLSYTTTTEARGIVAGRGPVDLNRDGLIDGSRLVRIPANIYHIIQPENRKRYSFLGSLDFKATDNLTVKLDGFYTKVTVDAVRQDHLAFFSNATQGFVSRYADLDGLPTATDFTVADLDLRDGGRYEDRSSYSWQSVGGVKYEGEGWTAAIEGSYGRSVQTYSYLNIATIANGPAQVVSEPGASLPSISYLNGFDAARLVPSSFRVASLNGNFGQRATDRYWDVKADIEKRFDDSFVTAVKVGARYNSRKQGQDNRFLNITGAGMSALFGGLPAGSVRGTFSAAPFMHPTSAGSGTFLGSYNGDAAFPASWLSSDARGFLKNYTDAELIAAGTVTNDATGIIDVAEEVFAGYGRVDFESGKLSGNVGLRAAHTKQLTAGFAPDLNAITVDVEGGAVTRVPSASELKVRRQYWDILPSLNLKLDLRNDLLLRFSASRTMARPNLMDISPTTAANGNARTVTRNNPYLDPFRSTNFDLTAEWYFQRDGVVGASLFYKKISSLIRNETTVQDLPVRFFYASTGTTTVSNLPFTVTNLVNGSGVNVKGVELYYQQAFRFLPRPLDGLGVLANYTFIDNSDPLQLTAASRHNFNATGYYERGPIGFRLSYSWRDGFLNAAALAPALNQERRPFGTLDGSFNLKLTENASMVLEAVNILDTDERTQYTVGLPADYIDAGRRIAIGARLSL